MAFWKVRVELMMNGASGDVLGIRDDEPMCMHKTVAGLLAGPEDRGPVVAPRRGWTGARGDTGSPGR